jgi:hypothetical protein
MVRRMLPGLLAVALVAGPVGAVVLASLLDAVAGNARAARALRADVVISRGDARTTAVLLLWRDVLYLETAGFRALVRGDKAVVVRGGHAVRAPVRTLIPGTDLLLEELPFAGVPLRYPQIQDEGPGEVVVSGAPEGPSLYVLIARTIDPERAIVVSTKYYKDDIAVLFKMRQDRAFTRVDGRWRPGEIEVEDFSEHSTTRLALAWKLAPDLPRAVFTPRGLRGPSGLMLPAAP